MMRIIDQNDLHQPHRIPVDPPKRDRNLKQYYNVLCSRKEILRTIEDFIGDIRWRLLSIEGVGIIDVTPFKLYIFRNGMTEVHPRGVELNVLRNYDHHGDAFQYPINSIFPSDPSISQTNTPSYNRIYRIPDP